MGSGAMQAEYKTDNGAQDHEKKERGRDADAQDEFLDVEVSACIQVNAVLDLPVPVGARRLRFGQREPFVSSLSP